jgi:adenine-specific DNA-methyltransferase
MSKKLEIEKLNIEIERLKKELKKRKKYGLVWEEKPEEVVEMCTNPKRKKLPVLKEVKNKEIITDKDKPVNLLIEGDNYHALSVLNYTHAKKVDVIYIDPPYNTGNKDFIFNDRYVDREDAYRHSKWLSFMEKRLKLAKSLLKDTGVIFVSIDDNEVAQLKLLMDRQPDLFGERNLVGILKWKRKKQPSFLHNQIAGIAEYILVYARNINFAPKLSLEKIKGDTKPLFNPSNKEALRIFHKGIRVTYKEGIIKKGKYKIRTMIIEYLDDVVIKDFRTQNDFQMRAKFRDGQNNIDKYITKDLIFITKNNTLRREISEEESETLKPITDLLLDWGQNQDAFGELRNIFGGKIVFENPKPTLLIKNLIKSYTKNKSEVILDFMAGTGTTGHAVLELNKEDGGQRRFILCTNNRDENGTHKICTDVCYPRIKKVIKGYKNLKGQKVEGLGGNLKYFKTDFVDYDEPTDRNKIKLTEQTIEMLCVKEGTFEEVLPARRSLGAGGDQKSFKIFKNTDHYTGIIFDQVAIPAFKKTIKDIKGKFSVYVFSLGDETFDDEFKDVKQKVQLSPIPEAILRVYRRIFK